MKPSSKQSRSASLYERALKTLPGGVSRNTVLRHPHPAYVDHAAGCRVVDIEGVERIDFANNMASLIHGHADPDIVAAVSRQLQRGSAYMMATEIEIEYAEYLCSRCDSLEKLRFVNSGTEAVMGMLKAARAFTGRPKIAKVEGSYHGIYDFAEISQTANPTNWGPYEAPSSVPVAFGTPSSVLENVIVLPCNDPERAISLLEPHRDEIACVILDPMPHRVGLAPMEQEFVQTVRDWTERHGALLVFDEVITFRTEFGGLQERYNVRPDLTAMGKMIGGGFPVGAIAGRGEVMDVMNPLGSKTLFPHSGTFSANPVTMTAGLTAMRKFDREAIARLNNLAQRAVDGIRGALKDTGVPGCVTGAGSMFRVHFRPDPPRNRREEHMTPEQERYLAIMLDHLFEAGFLVINTCSATLSTVMDEQEIDALVDAMAEGFKKLR